VVLVTSTAWERGLTQPPSVGVGDLEVDAVDLQPLAEPRRREAAWMTEHVAVQLVVHHRRQHRPLYSDNKYYLSTELRNLYFTCNKRTCIMQHKTQYKITLSRKNLDQKLKKTVHNKCSFMQITVTTVNVKIMLPVSTIVYLEEREDTNSVQKTDSEYSEK